jgi:predicted amidohydrolase
MISAIAQLRILPDRRVNLMKALSLVKRAIQIRASVVVLPELFNTGFYPGNYEEVEKLEDEISLILKLSERRDITVVGSLAEREGGKLYNTAIVIHRGKIIGKYRKTRIFPLLKEEKDYFSPGDEFVVIDSPIGKLGLMICYEIRFPEIARYLMQKGAEMLVIPAEFPKERIDHWKVLLRARAIENQCYVLGANCVGGGYPGNSMIIDPWGNVLVEAGKTQEVIMAEIDLEEVKRIREEFPFLRDRKFEG